jgi:hypothetical protein
MSQVHVELSYFNRALHRALQRGLPLPRIYLLTERVSWPDYVILLARRDEIPPTRKERRPGTQGRLRSLWLPPAIVSGTYKPRWRGTLAPEAAEVGKARLSSVRRQGPCVVACIPPG